MSDPISPSYQKQERQSEHAAHVQHIRDRLAARQRSRSRLGTVTSTAAATGDPQLDRLSRVSQSSVVGRLGIDEGDFFKRPDVYQATMEGPLSDDRDGFLRRMQERVQDGDLLNRRGDVGLRALRGKLPLDEALAESKNLQSQMSRQDWLKHLTSVKERGGVMVPWFERQIGEAVEMFGQQGRNLPGAAVGALAGAGAGAALAAPSGVGVLAGAAAGLGHGFWIGLGKENIDLMAGNAYMDFMEEPLTLPDGTEVQMPTHIARNMALTIGVLNGVIETMQMGVVAGRIPGANALRATLQKSVTKLIANGTLARVATRAATTVGAGMAENVAEEMAQEVINLVGNEIAFDLVEGRTGGKRDEAVRLGQELLRRLGEIGQIAPAFGFMSLPAAGVHSVVEATKRPPAGTGGASLFTSNGLVVPIDEVRRPDRPVSEQQVVVAREQLRQAARRGSTVRLSPLLVQKGRDGYVVVGGADDDALLAVMQTDGAAQVAVLDVATLLPEPGATSDRRTTALRRQAAEEAAAAETGETVRAGAGTEEWIAEQVRDMTLYDTLVQRIRDEVPENYTDDQVQDLALQWGLLARSSNLTLEELLDRIDYTDPTTGFGRWMLTPEAVAAPAPAPPPATPGPPPTQPTGEPPAPVPAAPAPAPEPPAPEPPAPPKEPTPEPPKPPARPTPEPKLSGPVDVSVAPTPLVQPKGAAAGRLSDPLVLWEDIDGVQHVMAGGQRATVGKKINTARQKAQARQAVQVRARLYRQADGYTQEHVRAIVGREVFPTGYEGAVAAAEFLRGQKLDMQEWFRHLPTGDAQALTLGFVYLDAELWNQRENQPNTVWVLGWMMPDDRDAQRRVAAMLRDSDSEMVVRTLVLTELSGIRAGGSGRPFAEYVDEVWRRVAVHAGYRELMRVAVEHTEPGQILHEAAKRLHLTPAEDLRRMLPNWVHLATLEAHTSPVGQIVITPKDFVQILMKHPERVKPGKYVKDLLLRGAPAPKPPPAPKPKPAPKKAADPWDAVMADATQRLDRDIAPPTEQEPIVTWTKAKLVPTRDGIVPVVTEPPATERPEPAPPEQPAPAAPPAPPAPEGAESDRMADEITKLLDLDDGLAEAPTLQQAAPRFQTDVDRQLYRKGGELAIRLMVEARTVMPFGEWAPRVLAKFPERHATRVRDDFLRPWYEIARESIRDRKLPGAERLSEDQEIDAWYDEPEAPDELAGGVGDRAAGERPATTPPPAREPGAGERGARERTDSGERDTDADERAAAERRGQESERARDRRTGEDRDDPERVKRSVKNAPAALDFNFFGPVSLAELETRGPSEKARDNIAAIELLKNLQKQGRQATSSQQAVLARYVGWGGLKGAFPDQRGETRLVTIGERLQEVLTTEEYESARRSIQFAHYTSEDVIGFIWETVRALGFERGKVLEPGSGVGHFAGLMPRSAAEHSSFMGIEMDDISAGIAQQLYPRQSMQHQDFTKVELGDGTFDLAIGNPPFSDVRPFDPKYRLERFVLHDYFFAKSIDAVRPGGLVGFVTSAGTMNKAGKAARQFMAQRADFIGGVRLPNTAFRQSAGTSVTTDVLFFRRRPAGMPASETNAEWIETEVTELRSRDGDLQRAPVNKYFVNHPEMILGDHGLYDTLVAGVRYGVLPRSGANLKNDLAEAVGRLIAGAPAWDQAALQEAAEQEVVEVAADDKEGSFYVNAHGQLMQRRDGVGKVAMRQGGGGKLIPLENATTPFKRGEAVAMVRDFISVRDSYRDVLAADMAGDEQAGNAGRVKLNATYDAYVRKWGPVNKELYTYKKPTIEQIETHRLKVREEALAAFDQWDEGDFDATPMIESGESTSAIAKARKAAREEARRLGRPYAEGTFDAETTPQHRVVKTPNMSILAIDPESYRLAALEEYDAATGTGRKTAAFEHSVLAQRAEPEIRTATDAMLYVMRRNGGRFDLDQASEAWRRPPDELIRELGDAIYQDPDGEWVAAAEYLSGPVVDKLARARDAEATDTRYRRNVTALEAVQPAPVPPGDITMDIGAAWIPVETFKLFVQQELGVPTYYEKNVEKLATGGWRASFGTSAPVNAAWGASADGDMLRSASEIFEAAMNNSDLKAPMLVDFEGRRYPNTEGDKVVKRAVRRLKDRFAAWVKQDGARAESLTDLYNGQFNRTVERQWRTDYIDPEATSSWVWMEHQLIGIARILAGNAYLGMAVGSGKTAIMIGAAMMMRRLGLARKPMFIVPNHMLLQFTKEWYGLYPTAKIMVADDTRFHGGVRKRFTAEAATGDFDGIIMTFSSSNLIPMSKEFEAEQIRIQQGEMREALEAAEGRYARGSIEAMIDKLEARMQRIYGADAQDLTYDFEQMGVDQLFVDEAHEYRKLAFPTTQGHVKNIQPGGPGKSQQIWNKTRYIEQINPGRGLVFASGTPITNTLGELYNIQRYMDAPTLKQHGLWAFDDWASVFGEIREEWEYNAAGVYVAQERFNGVANAAEVSRMVRKFMEVVLPADLQKYVTIPKLAGGQRTHVVTDATPLQEIFQDVLRQRFDNMDPRDKTDNHLALIGDGRLAALDMRMVNPATLVTYERYVTDAAERRLMGFPPGPPPESPTPGQEWGNYRYIREVAAPTATDAARTKPVWRLIDQDVLRDPGSKIEQMIDRVADAYTDGTVTAFHNVKPDGTGYEEKPFTSGPSTQLVFVSMGYIEDRLHVAHYMRRRLTARGVPDEEIAWINDYPKDAQKQRLFEQLKAGKVRILIGSEARMGTGLNVQDRLATSHNLMPQWYPSIDEQRVGRIKRQGNMNPEIKVLDYSTRGTYDETQWQFMAQKARMIEQFFRGDPKLRYVENVGEASVYAMAQGMATKDPRVLELAQLRGEIESLEMKQADFHNRTYTQRRAVRYVDEQVKISQDWLEKIRADRQTHVDITADKFSGEIGGEVLETRREYAQRLDELLASDEIKHLRSRQTIRQPLGKIAGFEAALDIGTVDAKIVLTDSASGISSSLQDDAGGLLQSLEAGLRLERQEASAQAAVVSQEEQLERAKADVAELEREAGDVSYERLDVMRARRKDLEAGLRAETEAREAARRGPAADGDEAAVLQQRPVIRPDGTVRAAERGLGALVYWEPELYVWKIDPALRALTDAAGVRGFGTAADAIEFLHGLGEPSGDAGGDAMVADDLAVADKLGDDLAERHGLAADGAERYVILPDGRALSHPGGQVAATMLDATDAVVVDERGIQAESGLSEQQIGALIARTPDRTGIPLVLTHAGAVMARMVTKERLNAATLRAHFTPLALGAVTFLKDGRPTGDADFDKAVTALSAGGDFDTAMEELIHVARRLMTPDQNEVAGEWAGARRAGDRWLWTREADEKFARGMVQWMRDEWTPPDALSAVFTRIREWLREVFAGLRHRLTPEIKSVYEDLLLRGIAPAVSAFNRNRRDVATSGGPHVFVDARGRRMQVRNSRGGAYRLDVEIGGRWRTAREHGSLDDALREVSGIPTSTVPVPFGHETMALAGTAAGRELEAADPELAAAAADLTIDEAFPNDDAVDEEAAPTLQQTADERAAAETERAAGSAQGYEKASHQYERRDALRYGRARLREIGRELAHIAEHEARTMPNDARERIRYLALHLEFRRRGRISWTRLEMNPRRMTAAQIAEAVRKLQEYADPESPGLMRDLPAGKSYLSEYTLREIEMLRRLVLNAVHQVRANQAGLRADRGKLAERNREESIRELRRGNPLKRRNPLQNLFGVWWEQPRLLIERIGGGLSSTLYRVLWRDVKAGILTEKQLGLEVGMQFERDRRAAGSERTEGQLQKWLNEKLEADVGLARSSWTRAEIMSLVLTARDPYARRDLFDKAGGAVWYDAEARAATGDAEVLTREQVRELEQLLDDESRAFMDAPVRNLFETLFARLNETFSGIHGYDLEKSSNYYPIKVAEYAIPEDTTSGSALEYWQSQGEIGPHVHKGMIEWRTGAIKPIQILPLHVVINRATNHAAAYVGLEAPLRGARSLMARNVKASMREYWGGDAVQTVLEKYLRDIAHNYERQEDALRWADRMRGNIAVGTLGFNPRVALTQALSYPLYGTWTPGEYLARAAGLMAIPRERTRIMDAHRQHDPDFAIRTERGFDQDLVTRSARQVLPINRSRLQRTRDQASRVFMFMIQSVDQTTVAAGMEATRLHAMDAFDGTVEMPAKMRDVLMLTPQEAQRLTAEQKLAYAYDWAREVTAMTQPSFLVENMSHLARHRVGRHVTMFTGYTRGAYNSVRYTFRDAREAGFRDAEKNRAVMVAGTTVLVVGAVGSAMLRFLWRVVLGDDEDRERAYEHGVKDIVGGVLALFPIVRDVGHTFLAGGTLFETPLLRSARDLGEGAESIVRSIERGGDPKRGIERVVAAAFTLSGIPYWPLRQIGVGIATD